LEVVTAQGNPKTRQAVQIGVQRIHPWGETDHFAGEWILLQMTSQMTADGIVCGRETIWNKWTPGDDYIHPGDVQDDDDISSSVAYSESALGHNEKYKQRDKTSHVKIHHA
jgi:hypothetical protein